MKRTNKCFGMLLFSKLNYTNAHVKIMKYNMPNLDMYVQLLSHHFSPSTNFKVKHAGNLSHRCTNGVYFICYLNNASYYVRLAITLGGHLALIQPQYEQDEATFENS